MLEETTYALAEVVKNIKIVAVTNRTTRKLLKIDTLECLARGVLRVSIFDYN
jgi:hypothetical protein